LVTTYVHQKDVSSELARLEVPHTGLADYADVLAHRSSVQRDRPRESEASRRAELAQVLGSGRELPSPVLAHSATTAARVYRIYRLPVPFGTEGRLHCFMPEDRSSERPGLLYLSGHFRLGDDFHALLEEGVAHGLVTCGLELHNFGSQIVDSGSHHFGAYLTLLGRSSSRPFIEEAEAALSVMKGLEGVDAARIGLAGVSFGGTLAAELGALRTDVASVAATAGTVDFASLVGTTGSDAEQHPIGLASAGGMEGVVELVSPRPLLLLFPEEDGEHGLRSSEVVVDAAREAYRSREGAASHLEVVEVPGGHDEGPPKRSAILEFTSRVLKAEPLEGERVRIPRARGISTAHFPPLLEVIRRALRGRDAPRGAKGLEVPRAFPGAPRRLSRGHLEDGLWALPASMPGEPQLQTGLWQLEHPEPKARVLGWTTLDGA
jgi:hypothetical protein